MQAKPACQPRNAGRANNEQYDKCGVGYYPSFHIQLTKKPKSKMATILSILSWFLPQKYLYVKTTQNETTDKLTLGM